MQLNGTAYATCSPIFKDNPLHKLSPARGSGLMAERARTNHSNETLKVLVVLATHTMSALAYAGEEAVEMRTESEQRLVIRSDV